jgi:hypothetical protein
MRHSTRSRFSNAKKLRILNNQTSERLTNTATGHSAGVSEGTIRQWRANIGKIREASSKNLSVHTGRARSNMVLESAIMDWMSTILFYGIPYNQKDVIKVAQAMEPSFKNGDTRKLANWASSFLRKEKIVLRNVTRYGRRLPEEIERSKADFVRQFAETIRAKHYPEGNILNLDQTGVFFTNPRRRILARRGATQVPIVSEKLSVRATAVLSITMDGQKLMPYIVFKGKRRENSSIARGFSRLPSSMHYSIQPKAWIDTEEMKKYIDTVLVPFMIGRLGQNALLLLDNFSVHASDTIKEKLQGIGFDLLYIPKGMTGILQPLDIAVNKPFKDKLKTHYTEWLTARILTNPQAIRKTKPKREDISAWMAASWDTMAKGIIRNSFGIFREEPSITDMMATLLSII